MLNSILSIFDDRCVIIRAAGRLKILILVYLEINLEINLKKQTMYINYQRQHMSFRSREKQSYLKRSVQLRSSPQLLHNAEIISNQSLTLAAEFARPQPGRLQRLECSAGESLSLQNR